jgi:hypothetical protein
MTANCTRRARERDWRRLRFARFTAFTLILLTCQPVYAHGQEVVFFPLGQLLAAPALIVITWRMSGSFWFKALVLACAVALATILWFVPGPSFPAWLRHTGTGNFLLGLLPPLIVAIGFISIARLFRGR